MTTTYGYDSANRLQTEVTPTQTTTYTFDANGNNTVKNAGGQLTTLTWDLENRMTRLQQPTTPTTMTFTYDGNSFRRSLHDGTNLTKFLNDWKTGAPGIDPILLETNSSDSTIVQYTPGMLLGLLSQRRGGLSRFYHAEVTGSIRQLTDSTQLATDTYIYDGFGRTQAVTGTTVNPLRYVAKENYYTDVLSGLLLLGVRRYDPSIGKFLSLDPRHERVNWYLYTQANPVNLTDPSGLTCALGTFELKPYISLEVKYYHCGLLFGSLCASLLVSHILTLKKGCKPGDIDTCRFIQWVKGKGVDFEDNTAVYQTTATNCKPSVVYNFPDWVPDSDGADPFYPQASLPDGSILCEDAPGFPYGRNCQKFLNQYDFILDVVDQDDIEKLGWKCNDLIPKGKVPNGMPYRSLVKARVRWNVTIAHDPSYGYVVVNGNPKPTGKTGCQSRP